MNMQAYGVTELSAEEMRDIDGGSVLPSIIRLVADLVRLADDSLADRLVEWANCTE
jgi:hypothetical protein